MNRKLQAVALIVVGAVGSCARQQTLRVVAAEEGPGLIEGTVTYEDGQPTKGATVSAFPLDRALAAKVPSADTDELGHFQINHLWLGKFAVTAKKEDEGYPNTSIGFYSDRKIPDNSIAGPSIGNGHYPPWTKSRDSSGHGSGRYYWRSSGPMR